MHKYNKAYKAKGACEFYRNLTELAIFSSKQPGNIHFRMYKPIYSFNVKWMAYEYGVKWYIALQ